MKTHLTAVRVGRIRRATNTAGRPIPVGGLTSTIAITPNGETAYVANTSTGTVTPIRTAVNKACAAIPVEAGVAAIAMTP